MKFDESIFTTELSKLNTINNNLNKNIENIRGILKSVKSDWICGASTEFCTNFSNSLDIFESYIDEFDSSIGYLEKAVTDAKSVETSLNALLSDF